LCYFSFIKSERKGIACVDFYLPDYNIIIEADGDYFHKNSKWKPKVEQKDKVKTDKLIAAGYGVYRFWEHEINESAAGCINKISELNQEKSVVS